MAPDKHSASGFTLVELSIVLVIIGLIIGGILVGKELILSAQMRQTGAMIEKLDTAVNTFRTKYNCLPGDCADSAAYGLGTAGNGDGIIGNEDQWGEYNGGTENFMFFQMLITANLIADTRVCTLQGYTCQYSANPQDNGLSIPITPGARSWWLNQTGAIIIISTTQPNSDSNNRYPLPFTQAYLFSANSWRPSGVLTPIIVSQLDRKFDDGLPLSGKIMALLPSQGTGFVDDSTIGLAGGAPGGAPALSCMNRTTTPYIYFSSYTDGSGCGIIWRTGF